MKILALDGKEYSYKEIAEADLVISLSKEKNLTHFQILKNRNGTCKRINANKLGEFITKQLIESINNHA